MANIILNNTINVLTKSELLGSAPYTVDKCCYQSAYNPNWLWSNKDKDAVNKMKSSSIISNTCFVDKTTFFDRTGYNKSVFKDKMHSECIICFEKFARPAYLSCCGNFVCFACVLDHINTRKDGTSCMFCRQDILSIPYVIESIADTKLHYFGLVSNSISRKKWISSLIESGSFDSIIIVINGKNDMDELDQDLHALCFDINDDLTSIASCECLVFMTKSSKDDITKLKDNSGAKYVIMFASNVPEQSNDNNIIITGLKYGLDSIDNADYIHMPMSYRGQGIGRAQRPGRMCPLKIIYLGNSN